MERALAISKALSDRNRLRMLMMLESGPLCLCHITEVLGLAASTVSKHLQILAEAGLVETWQEGRWHYFTWPRNGADPAVRPVQRWLRELLGDDATVRDDAARRAVAMQTCAAPGPQDARPRVLFLCTGNSCRSQMAEALLRKRAGDRFEILSAGLDPRPIDPLTFEVMSEVGLDIHGQQPKSVLDFLGRTHFAYLITVCANTEARCPVFPGVSYRLYWPFDDPAEAQGNDEQRRKVFRRVRDQIERRIVSWLDDLEAGEPASQRRRTVSRTRATRGRSDSETSRNNNGG